MTRHDTRMELTKDEVTLLLRCVYTVLDDHLMEARRKELLLLMDKLEYEYLNNSLDEPLR
jgi:hypothetical protein